MLEKLLSLFKSKEETRFKNKNVLIIEDNLVEQRFLQEVLEKDGYKVNLASTGKAGLEKLEEKRPDLVLLDGKLPDLTGTVVCKRIKQNEETRSIPVVFLTSLDSSPDIVDCYDSGADQYLKKPIKAKALLDQIETALKVGAGN